MSDDHTPVQPDPRDSVRTWPALDVHGLPPASDEGDESWDPASVGRDRLEAALTDFDVTAVQETSLTSWRVFFITPAGRDTAAAALPHDFPALTFASIDIPDEDWAARSQASLTPIRVGRVIVSPPWAVEDVSAAEGDPPQRPLVLVIQPSMGFGTGHHATTRLCLAALQRLPLQGRTVVDVGTGSGVLAIAASLLGASDVVGLDDDPDAIQAARDNLDLNRDARVTLDTADVRGSVRTADVVVANLTGGLLINAAVRLQDMSAPHGTLILSGLMEQEERDVLAAFDRRTLAHREQEDEWLCLTLTPRW